MSTLIVLAKECLPGRAKTRLHPPLTLEEAAEVASAALADTLELARAVRADRHLLWFDGTPPRGHGFEVRQQPHGTLDTRLAAAFDACRGRTLLIGMDTPQADPRMLQAALDDDSGAEAWFGPAADGGFWALGMDVPRGDLIAGVPMSTAWTGAVQHRRLLDAGLRTALLPQLVDVDDIDAARIVADIAPTTRFAAALEDLGVLERSVA
jgi:glycosyltransferase A (GT-A) superfamily protein (DUF2064 family)